MKKPMTSFELEVAKNKAIKEDENYYLNLKAVGIFTLSFAIIGALILNAEISRVAGVVFFGLIAFGLSNFIGMSLFFKRVLFGNDLLDKFKPVSLDYYLYLAEIIQNPVMEDWKDYLNEVKDLNRHLCKFEASEIEEVYLHRLSLIKS